MSVLISEGMSEFCVAACERITRKDSLITQLNQPNLKVTLDLSNLSRQPLPAHFHSDFLQNVPMGPFHYGPSKTNWWGIRSEI